MKAKKVATQPVFTCDSAQAPFAAASAVHVKVGGGGGVVVNSGKNGKNGKNGGVVVNSGKNGKNGGKNGKDGGATGVTELDDADKSEFTPYGVSS